MKIEEVEKRVGITSANIRYYEKEGLLEPERNMTNNYRDYSEEDVVCLQRIKILRMLGVGLADIKKVIDGKEELGEILKRRILEIKAEEEHLEELEKVCRNIVIRELSFETLDSQIINEKEEIWQGRLADFLRKDITQEWVTPKKMNHILGGMFFYFFTVNAVAAFLLGDFFISAKIPWTPVFTISVIGMFAVSWTAKMWLQIFVFQVITFVLTPLSVVILKGIMKNNQGMISVYMGTVMIMISVFVILVLLIYQIKETFFDKLRYGIFISITYSVISAVVGGLLIGNYWGIGITVFVITIYLAINWSEKNVKATKRYNKYYAVSAAAKIVNLPAQVISGQYVGSEYGYGRNRE